MPQYDARTCCLLLQQPKTTHRYPPARRLTDTTPTTRCQLAAAALAFELHRRLAARGVTACVADTGVSQEDLKLVAGGGWLLPPGALRVLGTPVREAAATVAHAAAFEWGGGGKGASSEDLR